MTLADLHAQRDAILQIAARYGASDVRVFGSVARGEANKDSDIDLLVQMEPHRSLLDVSSLIVDMEDLLGRPVDLAEAASLHCLLRDRVLREAVTL